MIVGGRPDRSTVPPTSSDSGSQLPRFNEPVNAIVGATGALGVSTVTHDLDIVDREPRMPLMTPARTTNTLLGTTSDGQLLTDGEDGLYTALSGVSSVPGCDEKPNRTVSAVDDVHAQVAFAPRFVFSSTVEHCTSPDDTLAPVPKLPLVARSNTTTIAPPVDVMPAFTTKGGGSRPDTNTLVSASVGNARSATARRSTSPFKSTVAFDVTVWPDVSTTANTVDDGQ